MSTFDGFVPEFPEIQIDYFRRRNDRPAPLAGFLSHIHSDHLSGLESYRSPFIYCSAATRELLLRLEKRHCRINYATGVLESREVTYKSLHKILKPIPLDTPTQIELSPSKRIQVTLLDANHCPGSVMFLIEGDGKAVLYTGDTRSEPWFVNSLKRKPALIPYVFEHSLGMKVLDKIYLDTSFTDDVPFQTKAEGIAELLSRVATYPPDTIFYIQAWTYGYEDVWLALSQALKSKVHVDQYKIRVYKSLSSIMLPESTALIGFSFGNHYHDGCLTSDEGVRLHSCEKGNECQVVKNNPVVTIQPVVAHLKDGYDLTEVGTGGGGEDLDKEAEMNIRSEDDIEYLANAVFDADVVSDDQKFLVRRYIRDAAQSGRNIPFTDKADNPEEVERVNDFIAAIVEKAQNRVAREAKVCDEDLGLPDTITFPYSRHSSLEEQQHLVSAFRPHDVWPCTYHHREWREKDLSISGLFGTCTSGDDYAHDKAVRAARTDVANHLSQSQAQIAADEEAVGRLSSEAGEPNSDPARTSQSTQKSRQHSEEAQSGEMAADDASEGSWHTAEDSQPSNSSAMTTTRFRKRAFEVMTQGSDAQSEIELISTTGHHTEKEWEL